MINCVVYPMSVSGFHERQTKVIYLKIKGVNLPTVIIVESYKQEETKGYSYQVPARELKA